MPGIFFIANKIGRFARPNRKNGNGFGMAYSTAERKRQSAAKKEIKYESSDCVVGLSANFSEALFVNILEIVSQNVLFLQRNQQ